MQRPSTQALRIGIFIVLAALTLLRVPELTYPGRFWAEEGTIYFHEAYTEAPGVVLLRPNLGYYSLVNKIGSLVAAHAVPLTLAPVATGFFAFLIQMLPLALILCSKMDALPSLWSKICACLLVLVVQPNQEVWLNTINSQFFLCVASGVLLVSEPTSRPWHVIRLLILSIAGLTGVVSCLLLPLFAISYAHSRSAHRLHESIALCLTCAIQGIFILTHPGREGHMYLRLLPFALLTKQWLLPFLGESVAESFSDAVKQHSLFQSSGYALAVAVPHLIAGFVLAVWGKKDAILLFVASVGLASISFMKSVDAQNPDWILGHVSASYAGRYYYAPNVFLALALLMMAWTSPLSSTRLRFCFRAVCCSLVALLLCIGTRDYVLSRRHAWLFSGPPWPQEVSNWRQGNSDVLHIWPRGWQMELPRNETQSPNRVRGSF